MRRSALMKIVAALFSLLYASSLFAVQQEAGPPGPPPHPSMPASARAKDPNLPVIGQESNEPISKELRHARSGIFHSGPILPLDTTEDLHFLAIADMRAMAELPVDDALTGTIICGEIVDKRVFMNKNQRGLYTEYTLNVRRTLSPLEKLEPGSKISIIVPGGIGRTPSGWHNRARNTRVRS
jgi:hypothetical protein